MIKFNFFFFFGFSLPDGNYEFRWIEKITGMTFKICDFLHFLSVIILASTYTHDIWMRDLEGV